MPPPPSRQARPDNWRGWALEARDARASGVRDGRSGGNDTTHDPGVLSDLPDLCEAQIFKSLRGSGEQEPALGKAPVGDLRDGFDPTAAGLGDELECSGDGVSREALSAVLRVDVDAGQAPVRDGWWLLVISTFVLDPGQLCRGAILGPGLAAWASSFRTRVRLVAR